VFAQLSRHSGALVLCLTCRLTPRDRESTELTAQRQINDMSSDQQQALFGSAKPNSAR
jgi:hypothetical protein